MPKSRSKQIKSSTHSSPPHKIKIVKSCHECHRRKVKCTLETPACSACLKHARTLGQDPTKTVCVYRTQPEPEERGYATTVLPRPGEQLDSTLSLGGRSLRNTKSRASRVDYTEEVDELDETRSTRGVPVAVAKSGMAKSSAKMKREVKIKIEEEEEELGGVGMGDGSVGIERPVLGNPRRECELPAEEPFYPDFKSLSHAVEPSNVPTPAASPTRPTPTPQIKTETDDLIPPYNNNVVSDWPSYPLSLPPPVFEYYVRPYSPSSCEWAHGGVQLYTPLAASPSPTSPHSTYSSGGYSSGGSTTGSSSRSYYDFAGPW